MSTKQILPRLEAVLQEIVTARVIEETRYVHGKLEEARRERDDLRAERDRALAAALEARNERDIAFTERDAIRRGSESGYLYRQVLAERNEARTDLHHLQRQVQEFNDSVYRLRAAFKCVQFEHVETAALRVVREREEAIRSRDAANFACQLAREQTSDWRTRFDALATRAADLVKERDEARAALADPSKLGRTVFPWGKGQAEPFKVGDRVVNPASNVDSEATVIAFFDSIDGIRFVAVETGWGRCYFWRIDLVSAVKS